MKQLVTIDLNKLITMLAKSAEDGYITQHLGTLKGFILSCQEDGDEPKWVYDWIPCSKELPKQSGAYLTTCKVDFTPDHVDDIDHYTDINIVYYDTEFGWNRYPEVYAWMPLPPKYTE